MDNEYFAELKKRGNPSEGEAKAYWAYEDRVVGIPVCTHEIWNSEVNDFVKTLRSAGCDQFVVADRSAGLMNEMFRLSEAGCRLVGLFRVKMPERVVTGVLFDTGILDGFLFDTGILDVAQEGEKE